MRNMNHFTYIINLLNFAHHHFAFNEIFIRSENLSSAPFTSPLDIQSTHSPSCWLKHQTNWKSNKLRNLSHRVLHFNLKFFPSLPWKVEKCVQNICLHRRSTRELPSVTKIFFHHREHMGKLFARPIIDMFIMMPNTWSFIRFWWKFLFLGNFWLNFVYIESCSSVSDLGEMIWATRQKNQKMLHFSISHSFLCSSSTYVYVLMHNISSSCKKKEIAQLLLEISPINPIVWPLKISTNKWFI